DEGFAALKRVGEADIDLVFLDYNMPGFSGIETLAEIKRVKRRVDVVIMTSVEDESLPGRAREYGAAFLKKPFYPADIDAVLCRFYGLRALNPRRACGLLSRHFHRELAVANARAEVLGVTRRRLLAVRRDQLGE